MAFEHFIHQADVGFELGEVLPLMVAEGDFGEDRHRVGNLGQVQMGLVAGNVPQRLQSFDPLQAWAGGQAHGIGQADVGHAAIFLKLYQNADVDPVQFR
ncbi:hypothetical protein D3C76_1485500 [compost metagenome]